MRGKRRFLLESIPYASIIWIRYIKAIVKGNTIAFIGYHLSQNNQRLFLAPHKYIFIKRVNRCRSTSMLYAYASEFLCKVQRRHLMIFHGMESFHAAFSDTHLILHVQGNIFSRG